MSEAIIVFGRVPEPGRVKTRLTPHLSNEQAAALYEAFVFDTLDALAGLDVPVRLYVPNAISEAEACFGVEVVLRHQIGADLGARMQHAFVQTFGEGFQRVVIIGTDHPTLPPDFIRMAFDALAEPLSTVIGPTSDGGYYLLGLNDFFPTLFEEMTFSHDGVFEETVRRATLAASRVTVLPEWYDVDRPEDLPRLAADLADDASLAPRTARVLAELPLWPQHPVT